MQTPRRALALLSASFGLSWVAVAMLAAPGPAALVALTGDPVHAGVYFGLFALSGAGGAAAFGRAMDRWGRRRPLAAAHLGTALGYALAATGFALGSLALFIAGVVTLAFSTGGIALTRLAAAELFEPAQRAGAVARVQVAATVAAVAGPLILLALAGAASPVVWFVAPPIYLASAALVWAWREDPRAAPTSQAAPVAAPSQPTPRAPFALGFLALVCAQGAMVTVMGVTGVELAHAGHGAGATSAVMSLHFLGMFGLSLVVGRIADRLGRRATILAGLLLLAAGGALVALVPGALGLALGLFLVGLGWSFAYIGGTVVLTDVIPAPRRARVVGAVDLSTALLAASASFLGGLWYAERGMMGLGLAAVALVAIPAVAALRVREATPGRYDAPARAAPSAERI